MVLLLVAALLWMLMCGTIGGRIGAPTGQAGIGCLLGIFLGPVGWLLAYLVFTPRSATPAGPSVLDQLQQLGHLRDAGVLSPAEFEQQKAKLLA